MQQLRASLQWFYNYRSIRLTPDGTRFVLLTLAVGVAAINTGNNLLYLLLAMMLSLIVISGMLSEQCLKRLDLRRRLPEHLFANRPTTAAIVITNRKRRFPTFSLRVMDLVGTTPLDRGIHLLYLPPRTSSVQTYPLLVARRGRYRLDGVKLLTPFPFGLFMKAAVLPLPGEMVVYPEVKPVPDHLLQDLASAGHEQPKPSRGQGSELYNLREYQAGDESRLIHWKTSARQGRLTVKETEAEDLRRATVVVPGPMRESAWPRSEERAQWEQKFEEAMSLAASLITHLSERGYAVRLVLGEHELRHGSGEAHGYRLLRALALAPALVSGEGRAAAGGPAAWRPSGDLTLVVAPRQDPRLSSYARAAARVLAV